MKSHKALTALFVSAGILALIYVLFITGVFSYAADAAGSLKKTYNEIKEFFGEEEPSGAVKGTVAEMAPAMPAVPSLEDHPHTEILESPYNGYDRAATASSLFAFDLREKSAEPVAESLKYGYETIPLFSDPAVSSVSSVLSAHGIKYRTITLRNTSPAGDVFAIRFAGLSDNAGYYINPSVEVILYVSAVKEARTQYSGDNLVYLTFDDGPSRAHTRQILDMLDSYGISGTFFTVGTSVTKDPELVTEMLERGHTVGCHSMTHVYSDIYSSVGALEAEIDEWEAAVRDAGIVLPEGQKYFRFPGGSVGNYFDSWKRADMLAMLENKGYKVYDWNVSANDAVLYLAGDGISAENYIKQSISDSLALCENANRDKTGEPVIVLMHESGEKTVDVLKWIIEYFIDRGYSFGSLANMGDSWTFSPAE